MPVRPGRRRRWNDDRHQGDVADESDVAALFDAAEELYGGVDVEGLLGWISVSLEVGSAHS